MEKFAAVFKKVQKINKAIIGAVLLLMIGVVFQISVCGIDRSWNQPRGDRSPVCPH